MRFIQRPVPFRSLAVLDPRVGHTMDALSPFISVLCPVVYFFQLSVIFGFAGATN